MKTDFPVRRKIFNIHLLRVKFNLNVRQIIKLFSRPRQYDSIGGGAVSFYCDHNIFAVFFRSVCVFQHFWHCFLFFGCKIYIIHSLSLCILYLCILLLGWFAVNLSRTKVRVTHPHFHLSAVSYRKSNRLNLFNILSVLCFIHLFYYSYANKFSDVVFG